MTSRDETIREIRGALRRRSGRPWSVTGPDGRADRKWRISCDTRRRFGTKVAPAEIVDHTYPNRDAAAAAERELIEKGELGS